MKTNPLILMLAMIVCSAKAQTNVASTTNSPRAVNAVQPVTAAQVQAGLNVISNKLAQLEAQAKKMDEDYKTARKHLSLQFEAGKLSQAQYKQQIRQLDTSHLVNNTTRIKLDRQIGELKLQDFEIRQRYKSLLVPSKQ